MTGVVGGRRPALEAVRSGRAREVLVARGARSTPGLRSLLAEAEAAGVPVRTVEAAELERFGLPDPQGVVASVLAPPELDERALSTHPLGPDALAVVLDGITDPQNLGACARSAEAAGAALLVTRRHRAAPLTPAAIRASAGALLHLPVARVANLSRALDRLKDRGFLVAGLDAQGLDFREAPAASRPLALVVGSEDQGLSRLVRERCDLLVALPLAGRTASLNASAALAAALFAYAVARRE